MRNGLNAVLLLILSVSIVHADDWPQWLGPKRDGIWREKGIVDKFPAGGPKELWRTPIGGGYAGPAVANGRVYVIDRILPKDAKNPANPFSRGSTPGTERVLCLNDADGKILWQHEYDCPYRISYPGGPRTTPAVADGKVYTLGAMGDFFCFDAANGKIVWSKHFIKDYHQEPPVWGWAAHPLVDGDKLICIVGGEESVVVAFHKDTGKELWRALTAKEPGYSPPMIYEHGGKRHLIIWHPEAVSSLDPQTGKVNWSQPFALRSGLAIPTPRMNGDQLFVTSFYNGPMMLKLNGDKAEVQWKGNSQSERKTDKLHAIMCTPVIKDGYIYGVCSYGQLRCLKADTGERVWETFKATSGDKEERWANAFLIQHDDRFFLFNEKGDLIIANLSPKGYEEIDRAHLLEPTNAGTNRPVLWSHPAFANGNIYARNDKEIVCVSLRK